MDKKREKKIRRQKKVRSSLNLGPEKIRISVFKSNTSLFVQFIKDSEGKTLLSGKSDVKDGSKIQQAKALGERLAKKALELSLDNFVFDRGGNIYTGRVKALADSMRQAGLKF